MTTTFVFSNLEGRQELLAKALSKTDGKISLITGDKPRLYIAPECRLVHIGDVFDRGPVDTWLASILLNTRNGPNRDRLELIFGQRDLAKLRFHSAAEMNWDNILNRIRLDDSRIFTNKLTFNQYLLYHLLEDKFIRFNIDKLSKEHQDTWLRIQESYTSHQPMKALQAKLIKVQIDRKDINKDQQIVQKDRKGLLRDIERLGRVLVERLIVSPTSIRSFLTAMVETETVQLADYGKIFCTGIPRKGDVVCGKTYSYSKCCILLVYYKWMLAETMDADKELTTHFTQEGKDPSVASESDWNLLKYTYLHPVENYNGKYQQILEQSKVAFMDEDGTLYTTGGLTMASLVVPELYCSTQSDSTAEPNTNLVHWIHDINQYYQTVFERYYVRAQGYQDNVKTPLLLRPLTLMSQGLLSNERMNMFQGEQLAWLNRVNGQATTMNPVLNDQLRYLDEEAFVFLSKQGVKNMITAYESFSDSPVGCHVLQNGMTLVNVNINRAIQELEKRVECACVAKVSGGKKVTVETIFMNQEFYLDDRLRCFSGIAFLNLNVQRILAPVKSVYAEDIIMSHYIVQTTNVMVDKVKVSGKKASAGYVQFPTSVHLYSWIDPDTWKCMFAIMKDATLPGVIPKPITRSEGSSLMSDTPRVIIQTDYSSDVQRRTVRFHDMNQVYS